MANITPLSTTPTQRGQNMLNWLLMYSPFFNFVDRRSGYELAATNFDLYPEEDAGDGVQTRAVGSGGYTKRSEKPPSRESESLGFHGDRLAIDRSHLRDDRVGLRPIGSWVPKRLKKKFKRWAKGIEKIAFRGSGVDDGNGREAKGILTLLDGTNPPGFTKTMVIDATDFVSEDVSSLDMDTEAHRKAFRAALEQILFNYDDPGVLVNKQLASVIGNIAQDATRYDMEQMDLWGKIERVFGHEMVRLVDGVITNTEPDNASTPNNNTTSAVLAVPDEGGYSVATNSGLYVKDHLDEEPDEDTAEAEREIEWEMRFESALQDDYSLLRIRNIKVAQGSEVYGFYGV